MARDGDAPPSEQPESTTTTTANGGAGGKIRKPPLNRNRPNPYARPPPRNQSQPQPQSSSVGGWFSKLVDPAYRLISGSANRMLPSFLTKSLSFSSLPSLDDDDQVTDKLENEGEQDDMGGDPGSLSNVGLPGSIPKSDGEAGVVGSKSSSFSDELKSGKVTSLPNDHALNEIEQFIKQKTLSRDEINRLLDILNSRNTDIPTEKGEIKSSSMIVRKEDEELAVVAETSSRPNAEKQEKVGRPQWKSVSPTVNPNIRDGIGASPIEIARAYMGKRMSGIGSSSKSKSEYDGEFVHGDGYLKPSIPSPSPKPSIHWPGAMVHDEYFTPQVQRGRYLHRSLARTPYSRSSHALSKTKPTLLQGDDRKYQDMSTPFQPTRTPIFGQQQSSRRILDGEYGSVGPIRSSRHKFRSGSAQKLVDSSPFGSPLQKDDEDSNGSFPFLKKNVETGGTSRASMPYFIDTNSKNIKSHATAVPMHSNQMARKILEHLDRNVVTVRDRSAELKFAAFGKKADSSIDATQMLPKDANLPYPTLSLDRVDQSTQAKVAHVPDNRETTVFKVPPERTMTKTTDALLKDKASDKNIHDDIFTKIGNAGSSSGSVVAQDVMTHNTDKMQGGSSTTASSADRQLRNLPNIPLASTTKSTLPSISIDKPESRRIFSSEQSSGFTFPVSSSSAIFPEPPTPSVMPPLTNSLPQPHKESEIPSYNFGSKRSSPAIVFSFPSSSNAAIPGVDSDLKFTFGSDKKRISFSSIEKDTICC